MGNSNKCKITATRLGEVDIYKSKVNPDQMEFFSISLVQKLKTTISGQGGDVFWRDQRRRSQGKNMVWVVTKLTTSQNNQSIYQFFWRVFQDFLNASAGKTANCLY